MATIGTTSVDLATEVRDVLNAAGGSVGNDLTTFFSASAKLNCWSKYKPVIYAANFLDNDNRWKGDGNCGFTFPNSSNYTDIPSWYNSDGTVGMNGWVYNIPTGTSSAPMRLGDFRGYCTVQYPLAQGFYMPEKGSRGVGDSVTAQIMMNDASEYGLALSNITGLSGCYFGVYMVNGTYSQLSFATTSGSGSVTISTSGKAVGTWTCYPFFSNATSHASGTKYYPVPNVAIRTIEIVSSLASIQIQITGTIDASAGTCTYKVLAKNTGSATTVANNYVYLKYDGNDLSDSIVTGEKSATLGSLSVPVSSSSYTQIYSGTFTGLDANLIANGKLWVTMGTGVYTASVYPMKSPSGQ